MAGIHWSRTPHRYGQSPTTSFYDRREKSIVQRLVSVKSDALVLDLCSGPGRWIVEYGLRGTEVVALDFSSHMLLSSKRKLASIPTVKDNIHFIVADAEHLPFVNHVFDIINCFDAYPHFPNQHLALEEMIRTAKVNATFIIEPSNVWSLIGLGISIIRCFSNFLQTIKIEVPIWTTAWNKYDTPIATKKLLKSFGLEIINMIGVLTFPVFSYREASFLYGIEEKMEKTRWFNFLGSRIVFICILC